MSLQNAEEIQISLVWYPSVNNQDLSINNGSDGQEAEHILKQLENLTAVFLSAQHRKTSNTTVIKQAVSSAKLKCVDLTLYFCITSFVNPYLEEFHQGSLRLFTEKK